MSREKSIKKCYWCGQYLYEKNIKNFGSSMNYSFYIICPRCKTTNVIKEKKIRKEKYTCSVNG